jgi:hypothetical protein
MKRETVSLTWRDERGPMQRVLEVSRTGCPVCRSFHRRRADTHGQAFDAERMLTSEVVPMVCLRCAPCTYYAIPIRDVLELRSLEELRAVHAFPDLTPRSWWARARAALHAARTEWSKP